MALKEILQNITNDNLAIKIAKSDKGENALRLIGQDVVEGYGVDWDSMADWREDIDKGLDLIKPATGPRDEPWQGAANFKTPILMEARVKFGDRASEELLGTGELVSAKVVGEDPQGEKGDRIERVEGVMNWQLTVESDSWVEEHDKLLYNLSCQGEIFKKTYFDPSIGHNVSDVITYPNFAINQATKTLDTAPRFTHRIFKFPRQITELEAAEVWRKDTGIEHGAKASEDNVEETKDDKRTEFYEQQTYLDLDDDGYDEPYIVTVHASTGTVMRIKAQYGLDDIYVMNIKTGITLTADKLVETDEDGNAIEDKSGNIVMLADVKDWRIIKITRDKNLTAYDFLTNPQDEFLSVGYFHVLGSYAQGINSTTNQLLDSGTLANLQGGWLAKGFRKRMGDVKAAPSQWHQTNLSAQDLKTGIMPHQYKEPSPTLHALNKDMNGEAQRLAATTDLGAKIGPNTPATTVLSMVHESQEAVGAIILRVYRAMTREFRIWYKLDSKYMDPIQYQTLTDNPEADPMMDFNTQDMDIQPSANPRNNSKIQRIQKAEASMAVVDQVVSVGGNPQPIVAGYLESIGNDDLEEIFPTMTPEQQAAAKAEEERIKQLEEQLKFLPVKAQQDIGEAEKIKSAATMENAKTTRMKQVQEGQLTQAKTENTVIDTHKKAAETKKIQSETDAQDLETDIVASGAAQLTEEQII